MADARPPDRSRSWARPAALLAAVTAVLAGLILLGTYLLHSERPIAGTPSPSALFKATLFTVPPRQSACMSDITLPANGRVLQFQLGEPSQRANPPLEVLLAAPRYRALARLPGEQPEGAAEVRVRPPKRDAIGIACITNRGTTPAVLAGSTEPRSSSRATLTLNGRAMPGDIALSFFQAHRKSRLGRIGEVFRHASTLTDRLIPVWLVWLIAVLTLVAVPAGIALAFYRTLREDELATPSTRG
ncbi:MAG TPA: hypothetical protein VNZ05_04270 [Solirubrobacteraceae bacterium]|jgi:hypothetical protein|nr:hypothetical protein [Solirubrobacteraceae bacterium]